MKISRLLIQMLAAWLALGLFMAVTNPASVPVIVLIIPFLLYYGAFYTSWRVLVKLHQIYRGKNSGDHAKLGVALSVTGVLLVILQSLGQLTVRDVITVGAIVAIGYLYITRTKVTVGRG